MTETTDAFTPRPPDWQLMVKEDGKQKWHEAGYAYHTEDGAGIKITLKPGITLRWDDDLVICLYPRDEARRKK
jgi:hypothetical protein